VSCNPVFALRTHEGHVYRIFADGGCEGFDDVDGVMNFIPLYVAHHHEYRYNQSLHAGSPTKNPTDDTLPVDGA
jgi:hypothetical protein